MRFVSITALAQALLSGPISSFFLLSSTRGGLVVALSSSLDDDAHRAQFLALRVPTPALPEKGGHVMPSFTFTLSMDALVRSSAPAAWPICNQPTTFFLHFPLSFSVCLCLSVYTEGNIKISFWGMNLWKKGHQAHEQHFAFGSSKVGRGPQTSIRTELAMPKDVQMPFWS